jgi:hypothetical protein
VNQGDTSVVCLREGKTRLLKKFRVSSTTCVQTRRKAFSDVVEDILGSDSDTSCQKSRTVAIGHRK